MLHAQNLFYIHILYTQKGVYSIFEYKKNFDYIHILYTQKGVYSIFEYKKNFEREAFRFSMFIKASASQRKFFVF